MKIESTAFKDGEKIPEKYTCDGSDEMPPLKISDVPSKTRTLALICHDPDAPMGRWEHGLFWNIPPATKEITKPLGTAGKNSWGRNDYGGPCPPSGTHRYFFTIYALDMKLDLPEGSTREELEEAMNGHIIEHAQIVGLYKRKHQQN